MPPILRVPTRYHDSMEHHMVTSNHTDTLAVRQVEEPSGPLPPVSPISEAPCSGWGCLTEAQQAGIIVTVVVVSAVLIFALLFFLRSKKKKDGWVDGDFVLVRQSRRTRAASQVSVTNFQRSQFFFRHEGLAAQQPPQFMATYPAIINVLPPPPPPVPAPLPMPMPLPVPFPQPQPIYPMVYQPHYHNPMQNQGQSSAPAFPMNTSTEQTQQPPKARYTHRARQAPHRSWTAGRAHQDTQQPPRRTSSLTRRLFDIFNLPVGRASTIASSDSGSTLTPSIRNSRQSRASATTISTPPSFETRNRGNISTAVPHTRVDSSSPTAAAVLAADYSIPTDQRDMSLERQKAKPDSSNQRSSKDNTIQITERETTSLRRSTPEEQNSNEHVAEQGDDIPTSIFQHSTNTGVRHIHRDMKPLRSALKNGKNAIETIKRDGINAQTEPPTRKAKTNTANAEGTISRTANTIGTSVETDTSAKTSPSTQAVFVSGRPLTSSMNVEDSLRKTSEPSHRNKVPRTRSHKDGRAETAKDNHQSFLDTAIRPVVLISESSMADSTRPVGASEMSEGHTTNAVHHLRETLRRTQESQFPLPYNVEIGEDPNGYSPPPSPPRPIHQGGGQYAPGRLQNKTVRRTN